MILRILFTLAAVLIIPIAGLAFTHVMYGAILGERFDLGAMVAFQPTARDVEIACALASRPSGLCGEIARLDWLRIGAVASGALAIATLLIFTLAAQVAGTSRRRNATLLPPLIPLTTLSMAAVVLLQGAASVYMLYVLGLGGESVILYILIGLIGLGAITGAIGMVASLRKASSIDPAGVLARAVTREDAPGLWAFVDDVARELDARPPRNLLVGLDPNFFATAAPVITPELAQPLRGETMYLSAPLMRLFREDELRAVVAHELGHFRGEDTTYSIRFTPVFRGLQTAILTLTGGDGRADSPATWAATAVLKLMFSVFNRNVGAINRAREFEADQAAVSVAGGRAIATSLAKVAVYAPLWMKTRAENVARLNAGRISKNLSRVFEDSARFDVSNQAIGVILEKVLEHRVAHPTDSHPPVRDRYAAVGFDPSTLTLADLTEIGRSSHDLFGPTLLALEEALTLIEHKVMLDVGAAATPEVPPDENQLLNAAYILAATMVGIDGSIDPREVQTAEGIGAQLFQDFDAVTFRETINRLNELPSFQAVVEILAEPLFPENKARLHAYLVEIAAADGSLAAAEKALLDEVARKWGVGGALRGRFPSRGVRPAQT